MQGYLYKFLPSVVLRFVGGWHVTPHWCLQHFVRPGHWVSCLQASKQTAAKADSTESDPGQCPGFSAPLCRHDLTHWE